MEIIDIFNLTGKESESEETKVSSGFSKDKAFSSLCARTFFLLLFLFDGLWLAYLICKMALLLSFHICFLGAFEGVKTGLVKGWLSMKRALLCGLSLFVALFNPAFGIMIACTYFIMYDKKGIEEVVPSSLREQFKGLFSPGENSF